LINISHSFRSLKYILKHLFHKDTSSMALRDLIKVLLDTDRHYYIFNLIEIRREFLLRNVNNLDLSDLGAGSKTGEIKSRSISSIVKNSASNSWQCQVMFRLIKELKFTRILELGTAAGISTSYFASASTNSKVYTMEGDPGIAKIANTTFNKLLLKNIELIQGNFDHTLDETLRRIDQVDLAFLDGNHRKEATLRYFDKILTKCNENSVIIIDDNHWSAGMEEAWNIIAKHPKVKGSIDFYLFGIVFLSNNFTGKGLFLPRQLS